MGFKQALQYARASLACHGVAAAKPADRSDDDLPFGMRIGSLLTLQLNSFVRANLSGSLVQIPEARASIVAISRLRLDIEGKIYRAYLSTGDSASGKETFLQLYVGASGTVEEALYCTRLTRFFPETAEEQAMFTGEAGAGLGQTTYTLDRDQLLEVGLKEAEVQAACADADHLDFERAAGTADQPYMSPFKGTENRVDDASGEHGLTQSVSFMPYSRSLGDAAGDLREHLLISCETVASIDGDPSKREIHVDFMVGIGPLEKDRFTIQ